MRYGFEATIAAITLRSPYDGKMEIRLLVSPSSIRWTIVMATLMAASSSFPTPWAKGCAQPSIPSRTAHLWRLAAPGSVSDP